MVRESHKKTVEEIRSYFESKDWKCKREVPVLRGDSMNCKTGRIDLCCQHRISREIKCFEIEDSGAQVVKNQRDLQRIKKDYRRKGIVVSTCQLIAGEDFRRVC